MDRPLFIMLVGLPGSGKSTYRASFAGHDDWVHISSDDEVDALALERGITYNEAFALYDYKKREKALVIKAKQAFNQLKNVIWDQTNLTVKSRAKKVSHVPDGYEKIAIIFPIPERHDGLWRRRLDDRPGKTIPPHVLESMTESIEWPTVDEGFDLVTVYDSFLVSDIEKVYGV